MKRILTYGNFDLFHIGHVRLLERASLLGDELYVGLSLDDFSEKQKNKKCIIPYSQRLEILKSCKYVSEVFPEYDWHQKITDIKKYNIDIFVMGNDWKGKFDYLREYCKVVYLARTPDISTTYLKDILKSFYTNK